jgi:hypothetical protein
MSDYLETLLEDKANEFAYNDDKVMTPMERVLSYQAFLAGCKFILEVTSATKPIKKDIKTQ